MAAATIAVVGIGVAVFEAALAIAIGVAAMWHPADFAENE
jgi:hypothetical protein